MDISYTDNFSFPKLDDGAGNWGAVTNGVFEDIDKLLYEARNPIVDRDGNILVNRINGNVVLQRYNLSA